MGFFIIFSGFYSVPAITEEEKKENFECYLGAFGLWVLDIVLVGLKCFLLHAFSQQSEGMLGFLLFLFSSGLIWVSDKNVMHACNLIRV